ncbi:MAG: hypothetical protein HFI87_01010 [Bacilli bacterium]|nr:hypothetical protein [Bacilli bacterium]
MKLKIALFFSIVILSVFLIYLTLLDKSISYLALGDFLTVGVTAETQDNYSFADYVYEYLEEKNVVDEYIKDFADNTYRTTDLIRDIKDNKQIEIDGKTRTLKNALIKADLLTVTVGTNDVISIMSSENSNSNFYDYLDSILVDMEELFGLLRQYCKEDIIVIGYYNPYFGNKKYESAFSYMNTKVNHLSQKYGINYVDIYDLYASNLDFLPVINDIHPSSKGYSSIFDMVKPVLDDTILK